MNLKVISGAQTGADVAGLWAAKLHGIPTGGWAPKGFRTLDGSHPEMAETFGIREHSSSGYPARTIQNLIESDFTLICSEKMSAGTKLTISECKRRGVPFEIIMLDPSDMEGSLNLSKLDLVINTIKKASMVPGIFGDQFVLNVAGNSTNNSARVFEFTYKVCHRLFTALGYTHFVEPGEWNLYKDTWK